MLGSSMKRCSKSVFLRTESRNCTDKSMFIMCDILFLFYNGPLKFTL
jgi:hypothetical protein